MSDPLLIVDADNVARRRGGAPERLRDELVADASAYAEHTGSDIILVFDGHGRDFRVGRVSVRHAAADTADTVIERLAHRQAATRAVTVVSSDTVLRHVAARGGVDAMSAREFAERLAGTPRPAPDPPARTRYQLADALDAEVRAALERLRRKRSGDA